MNQRCGEPGCANDASLYFFAVDQRKCSQEECRCEAHATEYWNAYISRERVSGPTTGSIERARDFDVTLVVLDYRSQRGWIRLREARGPRDVTLAVGTAEGWALLHELRQTPSPRPLTHRAMDSAITALGGRVDHVVVDSFDSAARVFHAKIRVQQYNALIDLDVRPSDAITIAVISGAPIVVAEAALANHSVD